MSRYPPYKNAERPRAKCGQVDVHELLKNQLMAEDKAPYKWNDPVSSNTGDNTGAIINANIVGSASNYIQPVSGKVTTVSDHGFEDYELYFDSLYSDTSSDAEAGSLRWPIAQLNNNITLDNIISITIGQFYIPNVNVPTGKPAYFYFGRLMIEIISVSSTQAINAPNNQRFHIECEVGQITGQAILVTPIKKTIFFKKPINYLDNFQIRFLVPNTAFQQANALKIVTIPDEVVTVTMTTTGGVGYNPIRFTISNNTTDILGIVGAITSPGLAVFLADFASNVSAINTEINDLDGQYITTIINDTDFEIAGIDASTVTSAYTAQMYIPKNRIAMPVRFTSRRAAVTNNIAITHD